MDPGSEIDIGGIEYRYWIEDAGVITLRNLYSGNTYIVNPAAGMCTCPDHQYRQHECKHLFALRRLSMDNNRSSTSLVPATAVEAEMVPATQVAGLAPQQQYLPAANGSGGGSGGFALANVVELAKALSAAQAGCRGVAKDKRNRYHGYDYASAEAVIAEAKEALATSGLALMPIEHRLDGHAKEGEDRFELFRRFLLVHTSGASMPITGYWPVCPEKGRPLDKALAISLTLSLSYTLRDLLLMPRVDASDDLAGTNSREESPAASAARPATREARSHPNGTGASAGTAAPDPDARITEDQVQILSRLLRETGYPVADLLTRYQIHTLQQLPSQHFHAVRGLLAAQAIPATPAAAGPRFTDVGPAGGRESLQAADETTRKIAGLLAKLGMREHAVAERLQELYGKASVANLSGPERADLLGKLLTAAVRSASVPTPQEVEVEA